MSISLITELSSFTKKAEKIFNKEELSELKEFLIDNPEKGDVIPATGGLRKMRWSAGGKGKRGGARVIYFYHVVGSKIYLMACYAKSRKEDITNDEKKQLRKLIESIIN